MSLGRPEKISRHWRGTRYTKRQTSKIRRLAEKRDPENAPTRNRYLGWTD